MRRLAFGEALSETYLGRKWLWSAARLSRKLPHTDLLQIIDVPEGAYRRFMHEFGFYVPMWVNGVIDISVAIDRLKKVGNIKEDLRRIRKNSLEYEVTSDSQRIVEFYQTMYLPYIRNVFGDTALLHSLEKLLKMNESVELLLVKRDEEALAGQILIYEGDHVRTREIGVKEGKREYVKAGVMGALYYYGLLHLKERGCSHVSLGESRAWLNDGVLKFKKKWGMELADSSANGFCIRFQRITDGISAFLTANPFITLDNGIIDGAFFADQSCNLTAKDVIRLHRDYYFPGMRKLSIYPLGDNSCNIEIPGELADQVFLNECLLDRIGD